MAATQIRPRLPAAPPSYIKPSSPFSPRERQCCQCEQTAPDSQTPSKCACAHSHCASCPRLDARGAPIFQHSFPASWVCSTCDAPHSVLDILANTGEANGVSCACGKPELQAVYDQFGRIFLFWRDDDAVRDLCDAEKVQEAAWRIWEAGAQPWLEDVLEREKERLRIGFYKSGSQSSKDSLDVVMGC